jgi:alkanesulfonate monooxygenase SsuD/methylene tetrahydromethanopterin reductase-like flavin-dependent oxidoreductase (luciferase family)
VKPGVGIALRSTVFPPHLIPGIVPELDPAFSNLWFPSVSTRFDVLDMCGLSLGASRRLIAGTGVIRLHEQDLGTLASRADTLSQGSRNRFVLGVGTGSLSGRTALDQLVALTKKLRAGYPKAPQIPIYFAALGPRMVRAAYENADGVLLNFCSPRYASGVISRGAGTRKDAFQVACYVKLFFAESEAESRRMLANEFASYGAIPQYHMMFEAMGITRTLDSFMDHREVSDRDIAGEISEISLPNPTRKQLRELLEKFREAGVDSPVVYPYVTGTDEYKLGVALRLRDWLK